MLVNRDPFARTELHRETVAAAPNETCSWCGGVFTDESAEPRLYEYRTESDGGRKATHKGRFCCKSCHDAYLDL